LGPKNYEQGINAKPTNQEEFEDELFCNKLYRFVKTKKIHVTLKNLINLLQIQIKYQFGLELFQ
jgi:hypothetical protein